MSKVLGIMLSNTVSQYHEDMTNRAINTAFEHKGTHDLVVVVVETNNNFHGYFNNPNVAFIKPSKPFGYNEFINIGYDFMVNNSSPDFEDYEPDYVMIMNNDLIFHENWLDNLVDGLESDDYDSVSPKSPGWMFHANYCNDGIQENHGVFEGWGVGFEVCGWAWLFRHSSYARLQPLDPDLKFWCQDNQICDDMQKLGMRHALVSDSLVTHLVNQSHNTIDYATMQYFTSGMVDVYNNKRQNL